MIAPKVVRVADKGESTKPNLALIALAFVFCWPLAIWLMWHHEIGSRGERIALLAIAAGIGLYALFLAVSGTR